MAMRNNKDYAPENIVKALRICRKDSGCNGCPLRDYEYCVGNMKKCAADLIEEQLRQIAELEAQMRWIPVTERLPEPVSRRNDYKGKRMTSETVLCVCVQNGGKRMVKEGRCEFYGGTPVWRIPGTIDSVTHWTPMPKPPKEVSADA